MASCLYEFNQGGGWYNINFISGSTYNDCNNYILNTFEYNEYQQLLSDQSNGGSTDSSVNPELLTYADYQLLAPYTLMALVIAFGFRMFRKQIDGR